MTNIKIEGAIDDLKPRQLEYLVEVLSKLGDDESKAIFETIGKPGDNFMAKVKRIRIKKDNSDISLIVKIAETDSNIRKEMRTATAYHNEHLVYNEVFPKLTELEESADVPMIDRLRYPACYGCLMEQPYEMILLEDLGSSGFMVLDKNKTLSDQAVRHILKNFAKLHSLSFAWKSKNPESFSSLVLKLKDSWNDSIPDAEQKLIYFTKLEKELSSMFDDDDEKYKNAIKGYLTNIFKNYQKIKVDENSKYSVIVQGDAWTNNIMFRIEGENILDCCMIDYQQTKINSPVGDIMFMIFLCTDYEMRSKYYHDWIGYYHEQLKKHLDNFNLKVNSVYPKDQLDADLKRQAKFMFSVVLYLNTLMKRGAVESDPMIADMKTNNIEEVKQEVEASGVTALKDNTVKKLTKELVDSFLELGYL